MAMEITNSYSTYAANYAGSTKKSDDKAAEAETNTSTSSKDKVQEYYEQLCKKFPEITFNTSGTIMSGSENKLVINLSYECLKKMASDPEFAKEVEWNLSGEAAGHKWMYAQAKRDGAVIHGDTRVYDANGNITGACNGMTRTSGTKQNSTILNTENKNVNSTEKFTLKETGSTQELSEAEKLEAFKKEIWNELDSLSWGSSVSIQITDKAFEKMMNDSEFKDKMMNVIREDARGSHIMCGGTFIEISENGYHGYSYMADHEKEANATYESHSKNSFYSKKVKKQSGGDIWEQKRQELELQQELRDKEYFQHKKLTEYWNKRRSAANSYEANILTVDSEQEKVSNA